MTDLGSQQFLQIMDVPRDTKRYLSIILGYDYNYTSVLLGFYSDALFIPKSSAEVFNSDLFFSFNMDCMET